LPLSAFRFSDRILPFSTFAVFELIPETVFLWSIRQAGRGLYRDPQHEIRFRICFFAYPAIFLLLKFPSSSFLFQ